MVMQGGLGSWAALDAWRRSNESGGEKLADGAGVFTHLWSVGRAAAAERMVVFLLTVLVKGFAAGQPSCLGPPYLLATFHGGSSSSDVNQVALRASHTHTHAG